MYKEENFTHVATCRHRITFKWKSEYTQIYTDSLIQNAVSFQKYMDTDCINSQMILISKLKILHQS